MSSVNIDLAADTILNVMVGQQDENEVREVVFDFSDWYTTYGSGTISLAIQRPKDEWPYDGTLTVDNSTHKATWEISDTDSAYAGVGQIQLSYTVGTAKKKSVVYRFTVHKSLGALGNVITPIQIQTFIDEVTEALEDMQEELTDIKQDLEELQNDAGVTAELKSALLQLASKVAYIDDDGQSYYDDLYDALYPNASSISCVYTQTGTVYTTDTLDSLKDDLVVTAHYSDSTTKVLKPSDYTLTGTLSEGTSTVSVHYGDLVTTFTVTVTARTLSNISAVYTQSGYVYTDDDINDLKVDLVVTAHYNDTTTETLSGSDYTLSGTLTSGTSTITVTYEDKTTTFTVTVSAPLYPLENGSTSFSNDWSVVVSEGKNVLAQFTTNNNPGCFANISKVSLNSATSTADANFVNNGDPWITLSQGDVFTSKITITSVNCVSNETDAGISLGLKEPSKTNIENLTVTGTKVINLTVGEVIEHTYTAESAVTVGCIGFWCGNRLRKNPITVGFTLEAYINGVRIV